METLRVHFLTTSAGPDGVWQAGTTHALPVEEAERLIAAGAAVEVGHEDKPEALSESVPLQTKDSGPFSDDEWAMGITLEQWAQWRAPDAYAQREANPAGILILDTYPSFQERTSKALRREADAILQSQLREDLGSGVLVLGTPPETLYDKAKQVSPAVLPELLKRISGSYRTFQPSYRNTIVELRLYKVGQFSEMARPAGKDETRGSESAARSGDRHLAPKGKRGRKPKWDWEGATREMFRLANSIDGLPGLQADLEGAISDWFERHNNGESPSESHIRKFVVKNLPPDYRDG